MNEAGNHTRVIHPQVWILLWISTCEPRFRSIGASSGLGLRARRASPESGIHERDTQGRAPEASPPGPGTRARSESRALAQESDRSCACDYRHLRVMRKPTIMMARPITMFHQEMLGIG